MFINLNHHKQQQQPERITHYIQHKPAEPWHIHPDWAQRAVCGALAVRYNATATPPKDTVPSDLCQVCRERYGIRQLTLLNTMQANR